MYLQANVYIFEQIISKYQDSFRKEDSAQHALISLLEKWCFNVDQGHIFGALLTDLSKSFDCFEVTSFHSLNFLHE